MPNVTAAGSGGNRDGQERPAVGPGRRRDRVAERLLHRHVRLRRDLLHPRVPNLDGEAAVDCARAVGRLPQVQRQLVVVDELVGQHLEPDDGRRRRPSGGDGDGRQLNRFSERRQVDAWTGSPGARASPTDRTSAIVAVSPRPRSTETARSTAPPSATGDRPASGNCAKWRSFRDSGVRQAPTEPPVLVPGGHSRRRLTRFTWRRGARSGRYGRAVHGGCGEPVVDVGGGVSRPRRRGRGEARSGCGVAA